MFSDANSARYMISALIQSEAAILGIVITLSLLVVQQSATSLSPRVISIFRNFKKNPDFYLLMMIYLGAMLYSSLVLKAIKENLSSDYINFNSLEPSSSIGFGNFTILLVESSASFETQINIWITFFVAIFAFIALIFYIRRTMDLLNPSNIIHILAEDITSDSLAENLVISAGYEIIEPSKFRILTSVKYTRRFIGNWFKGNTKFHKDDDPLLPLIDIIRGSLMRYDYETSTNALKTLEDKIVTLIEEDDFDTLKYCKYEPKGIDYSKVANDATNFEEYQHYLIKKIYINIFNHFERVGQLAIKHLDYHSSKEITAVINHLIEKILEKEKLNPQAEATIIEGLLSLQTIGTTASKSNMDDILIEATKIIKNVGNTCVSKKLDFIAHKSCKILINLSPNSVDTWLYVGNICSSLGKRSNAISAFTKANKIKGTSEAYSKLHQIYTKIGWSKQAEDAFVNEHLIYKEEEDKMVIDSMIDDL
jgi:hypothetical protein